MNTISASPTWIWHMTLNLLSRSFTSDLEVFFNQVNVISMDDHTLILHSSSPWDASILNGFLDTIQQAVSDVLGQPTAVRILDDQQLERYRSVRAGTSSHPLDKSKRFDNFIVGASNEFAFSAAQSITRRSDYNPLMLYGESGSGKTHLLMAIGNHMAHSGLQVMYTTGDDFTVELLKAVRSQPIDSIKHCVTQYLSTDVLLLDDIQYLAGKDCTQEAFLDVLDCLVSAGKQVVLTADRPLSLMNHMDTRILNRCVYGLTAEVSIKKRYSPNSCDTDTILRVLDHYAAEVGVTAPEYVRTYVARHVDNGFAVQGIVKCLSSIVGTELSERAVLEQLPGLSK